MTRWSTTARILRVDHGGEHGAIRIYRAQIAFARIRCPDLAPLLSELLAHEREHLETFRSLMPSRASRPCRMMWLWGIGGSVLGAATGLAGRDAILVCTQAVELTVHRHLEDQARYLADEDPELAGAIRAIQAQELGHLQFAQSRLGPPRLGAHVLAKVIAGFTEALIWLSTRGDSVRLARQLSAAA